MVPEETTTFGDQDKLDFEAESTKTSSSTATGTLYWSIGDNCKPRHYVHGDNFHIFCQRFVQYATLNKFTTFLDVRFLSLVDNRTHSKLLDAKISDEDKPCPHKLVAAYEKAMNLQFSDGDIMSALFAIEQKSGETIDDLIYRINLTTDKSCNLTDAVIEKSKIAALCNAVKDQSIKTELRKNKNFNWKDAVEIVQIMDKHVKSCDHEVNFINIHSRRNGDETVRGANQLKSAGEARGHRSYEHESTRGPRGPGDLQLFERKFFKASHCYVCGERNHKAKHCHHRFQNRFINRQQPFSWHHSSSSYRDQFKTKFSNSRQSGRKPMRNMYHVSTDQINRRLREHGSYMQ